MGELSDDEFRDLIRRAKDGDRKALNDLFGTHFTWLTQKARSLATSRAGLSSADPEDFAQEAITRAIARFATFEPQTDAHASFAAWLATYLQNVIHEAAKKVHEALCRLEQDVLQEVPELAPTPSRKAAGAEADGLIAEAVADLPEPHRTAIELHYFKGLTMAQVAERLAQSREAVNGLLSRARKKLAERLGSSGMYFFSSGT